MLGSDRVSNNYGQTKRPRCIGPLNTALSLRLLPCVLIHTQLQNHTMVHSVSKDIVTPWGEKCSSDSQSLPLSHGTHARGLLILLMSVSLFLAEMFRMVALHLRRTGKNIESGVEGIPNWWRCWPWGQTHVNRATTGEMLCRGSDSTGLFRSSSDRVDDQTTHCEPTVVDTPTSMNCPSQTQKIDMSVDMSSLPPAQDDPMFSSLEENSQGNVKVGVVPGDDSVMISKRQRKTLVTILLWRQPGHGRSCPMMTKPLKCASWFATLCAASTAFPWTRWSERESGQTCFFVQKSLPLWAWQL